MSRKPLSVCLRRVEDDVTDYLKKQPAFQIETIVTQLRFLSDTFAFSAHSKEEPDENRINLLVWLTAATASRVIRLYVRDSQLPLTLRGCITVGKHTYEKNFLVGPAVDEAAEHMNIADGPFIWLLQDAAERCEMAKVRHRQITQKLSDEDILLAVRQSAALHTTGIESSKSIAKFRESQLRLIEAPFVIPNYPMPLKDGRTIRVAIVNPLIHANNAGEREALTRRYEAAMESSKIDVQIKKQNALEFLSHANRICEDYYSSGLNSVQVGIP